MHRRNVVRVCSEGIMLTLDFPLLGVPLAGVEVATGLLGTPSVASLAGVLTRGASLVGGVFTGGASSVGGDLTRGVSSVGGVLTGGASSVGGDLTGGASSVGGVLTRGASSVGGVLTGGGGASLVGGVLTRGGLLFSCCCGVFLVGVSSHWPHEVSKSFPSFIGAVLTDSLSEGWWAWE